MAEYIEREAFLKCIEERYCLPCKEAGRDHNGCKCRACWVDDMCGEVIDAPADDVAPVVHGRWIIKHKNRGGFHRYTGIDDMGEQHTITVDERIEYDDRYCSECGKQSADNFLTYCPNCGARMDGDSDAKAD